MLSDAIKCSLCAFIIKRIWIRLTVRNCRIALLHAGAPLLPFLGAPLFFRDCIWAEKHKSKQTYFACHKLLTNPSNPVMLTVSIIFTIRTRSCSLYIHLSPCPKQVQIRWLCPGWLSNMESTATVLYLFYEIIRSVLYNIDR